MRTFSGTAAYERTNRYKTRDVVKTDLNVTFHVMFILATSLPSRSRHFQTRSLRGCERLKTDLHKSDIQISFCHMSCFIYLSVRSYVAVSKAKLAENVHIVLSSPC